jgi:hypothetical protein
MNLYLYERLDYTVELTLTPQEVVCLRHMILRYVLLSRNNLNSGEEEFLHQFLRESAYVAERFPAGIGE